MVAADLDHNGKIETLLLNLNGPQATFHVFQPDGSERPGWPVDVSVQGGNQFPSVSIAVGDFNRDGHEEIVLSREAAIYLFNSDGTLFPGAWPLTANIIGYGSVVIGDVDGDGFPEIVTSLVDLSGSTPQLLALRSNGSVAKSWALIGLFAYPAPALGDFNQDGTTDIAVAYEGNSTPTTFPGVVTILDTHAPFDSSKNDWPFIFQNVRNNPVLLRTTASSLSVGLTTGSNPSVAGDDLVFTATVIPATASGAVQFLDGNTPISNAIPLSNGAASFSTAGLALGAHSITARYTGNNQLSASVSPALIQNVNKAECKRDDSAHCRRQPVSHRRFTHLYCNRHTGFRNRYRDLPGWRNSSYRCHTAFFRVSQLHHFNIACRKSLHHRAVQRRCYVQRHDIGGSRADRK